jgi:hypothetical protein
LHLKKMKYNGLNADYSFIKALVIYLIQTLLGVKMALTTVSLSFHLYMVENELAILWSHVLTMTAI